MLPWKGSGAQAGAEVTNVQVIDTDRELGDWGNREVPLGTKTFRRTWDRR